MKPVLLAAALIGACTFSPAFAAPTDLHCDASTRCNSLVENCQNDPWALNVVVDPDSKVLTIGGYRVDADFGLADEVYFTYARYRGSINRNQSTLYLAAEGEVRYGKCKRLNPAW